MSAFFPTPWMDWKNTSQPEPDRLVAGDSTKWEKQVDQYPPGDGWVLSYGVANEKTQLDTSGWLITTSGNKYSVQIPATVTTTYAPGVYRFQVYVTKYDTASPPAVTERYTVSQGEFTIEPNLGAANAAGGVDNRGHSRRMLDAIRALLEGKVISDAQEYEIAGRRLVKMTIAELQNEERIYAWRVARENGTAPKLIGARLNNAY